MDSLVGKKPLRIPRPKVSGREVIKTPLPDYDDPPTLGKDGSHGYSESTATHNRLNSQSVTNRKEDKA